MTDVYIVGVGMTPLGKFPEKSVKDLTRQAVMAALEDAGCAQGEVEAAWFANTRQAMMEGQNTIRGQCALRSMGFEGIPIANVENACASSSTALVQAFAHIKAELAEIALVVGAEKMVFPEKREETFRAFIGGTDIYTLDETRARLAHIGDGVMPKQLEGKDTGEHSFFMDIYAAEVREHMERHGSTPEDYARVTVKNHYHGSLNPFAQYRNEVTVEEVLDSPEVVYPLTRLMCSPIGDGAAAVIIGPAARHPRAPVVAATAGATAPARDGPQDRALAADRSRRPAAAHQPQRSVHLAVVDREIVELAGGHVEHEVELRVARRELAVQLARARDLLVGRVPTRLEHQSMMPTMRDARAKVLAACKKNKIAFLNTVRPNDVEAMIKEGVMIGAGQQAAAERGRKFTKREMPW